jgi:hypothetical protein
MEILTAASFSPKNAGVMKSLAKAVPNDGFVKRMA